MARSKAAKEAAEKERKAIREQLKLKKEEGKEEGKEKENGMHPDIGLPEERKDATALKLMAAFRKRGWSAIDDDGAVIGIIPKGADMEEAFGNATTDAAESGYTKSYGVRIAGYDAGGKKKTAKEEEREDEDEEEEEDE